MIDILKNNKAQNYQLKINVLKWGEGGYFQAGGIIFRGGKIRHYTGYGLFCIDCYHAVFLPAVHTISQPVNLSRTVSLVVYTTGELGTSRDFPNFDLHL